MPPFQSTAARGTLPIEQTKLRGKASAVQVGWPGWRGHYRVTDARSLTLRLPDGREALLDINGGRFTGLSEWPEQT